MARCPVSHPIPFPGSQTGVRRGYSGSQRASGECLARQKYRSVECWGLWFGFDPAPPWTHKSAVSPPSVMRRLRVWQPRPEIPSLFAAVRGHHWGLSLPEDNVYTSFLVVSLHEVVQFRFEGTFPRTNTVKGDHLFLPPADSPPCAGRQVRLPRASEGRAGSSRPPPRPPTARREPTVARPTPNPSA